VAEAAAMIVGMALDPLEAAERVAPSTTAPARRGEGKPMRVAIGARAKGDIGSLPAPSLGASVAVAAIVRRLELELEAAAWMPRIEERGPVEGSGGSIALYAGGFRGCWDALAGSTGLRAGPCLAAELGFASGRGINIRNPETSRTLWGAALLGASVRQIGESGLSWGASLEIGLPFRRATYEIEGYGDVFRASPVIGRLSITMAWIFP
jgi:hypothetical protein